MQMEPQTEPRVVESMGKISEMNGLLFGTLINASQSIKDGVEPDVELYDYEELREVSAEDVAHAMEVTLPPDYSVRPVDSKYFKSTGGIHSFNLGMYQGEELLQLFSVSKASNGIIFREAASAEEVALTEKLRKDSARHDQQHIAGAVIIETFKAELLDKIASRISDATPEQLNDVERHLKMDNGFVDVSLNQANLETICAIAATLGIEK